MRRHEVMTGNDDLMLLKLQTDSAQNGAAGSVQSRPAFAALSSEGSLSCTATVLQVHYQSNYVQVKRS